MIDTLSEALAERGYATLTPVQEAVTDPELEGADLLVSAQTGSGKTVGFGLAIAPTILEEGGRFGPAEAPLALIIAPTRELAFQVARELEWLYGRTGARVATCVGGMDMQGERRTLSKGAHIVVGTPGRLRDHIGRGSLDMTSLRAVVLDEADEMLDLGFREDLEFMLGEAPEGRRTLLFSATVPKAIATLAQQYQRDAVRVQAQSKGGQHADIAYQALRVVPHEIETAIANMLRFHDAENAIVFANTRAAVARLTARLSNRGFAVVSLSGELSQTERGHALQAMRDGRARVCVATDVAARGIDLPNLDLVVHAELPTNTEGLLHRSGRTGRAGRKGVSALMVPPKLTKKAERLLGWAKVSAEWTQPPTAEEIRAKDEERLLSHEVWAAPLAEEETAIVKRLLAERSAEEIAAACLRLYSAGLSAPEELSDASARPERAEKAPRHEREPFGPSGWISLSVGRNERAEARWLLPLLCRAGGLDKDAIGAIRVQGSETFVELSEPSIAGFFAGLGADGQLEEGIKARRVEGTPDFGAPTGGKPAPRGKPGGKPAGKPPREERRAPPAERAEETSRPAPEPAEARAPEAAPDERPGAVVKRDWQDKPREERPRKPGGFAGKGGAPKRDGKPGGPRKDGGKPYEGGKPYAGKPAGKGAPARDGKPGGGKPGAGKSFAGKGGSGKPWAGKDGAGKKPGGKPGGPKRGADARDTSKRFTPPTDRGGAAKPRRKP